MDAPFAVPGFSLHLHCSTIPAKDQCIFQFPSVPKRCFPRPPSDSESWLCAKIADVGCIRATMVPGAKEGISRCEERLIAFSSLSGILEASESTVDLEPGTDSQRLKR